MLNGRRLIGTCAMSLPVKHDPAARRREESADQPQDRGLAGAARAEHDQKLAVLHGKVDRVEDFDRAVGETDALKFDDARHEPRCHAIGLAVEGRRKTRRP